MSSNHEDDPVSKLQSQVESLRKRVEELEEENARLSSRLSGCRCREGVSWMQDISGNVVEMKGEIKADDKKSRKTKGGSMRNLMHCPKRYVALRVTYFGQRFYGFASEAQQEPTVESELFKALEKTRLSVGDKRQAHYSRCGRTDKGVSSVGQVIALLLRSRLRDNSMTDDEGEIDYVVELNRALPEDIRVTGWCPVSSDFSARFSCLSREYKYFFWRNNLDTVSMKTACDKLVGEHDFRNFCKMDAVNVHNYRRRITSFTLCPCDTSYKGNELWALQIKGSAFLWHQVRCMVAVLFMIGQGIESPDVIDALLDTEQTPRKPQYIMAPEVPLVLQSCEFEGLNFRCSSDAWKTLYLHLENAARDYELQVAICSEALLKILPKDHDWTSLSTRTTRKPPSHIPLMRRSTEPSYDERRAKFKSKQGHVLADNLLGSRV